MLLSIVIPVHNEEENIAKVIKRIEETVRTPHEIIVVDDGSDDGSSKVCNALKPIKIRIFKNERRMGKGFSIRKGFEKARGNVLIIQDGDLEYDPAQILKIIEPIMKGKSKAVFGSRFAGRIEKMSLLHFLGNKILTWTTNSLFGSELTDMETCYKAFSRDVLRKITLKENGFEIEAEMTLEILKKGFQISEVPISYSARKKGKKIGYLDGLRTFWFVISKRFDN